MNAVARTPFARNVGLHPVKPPSASEGYAVKTETSRSEVTDAVDGEELIDVEMIQDSTESILGMRLDTWTSTSRRRL